MRVICVSTVAGLHRTYIGAVERGEWWRMTVLTDFAQPESDVCDAQAYTIQDLITRLQSIAKEHGNLPVCFANYLEEETLGNVDVVLRKPPRNVAQTRRDLPEFQCHVATKAVAGDNLARQSRQVFSTIRAFTQAIHRRDSPLLVEKGV